LKGTGVFCDFFKLIISYLYTTKFMATQLQIFKRYFKAITRLTKEEAERDTEKEILSEVNFKGANLWLLFFTMLIACIGLNMNSQYAVIGAMLMSPLMAPIIGLGFALGTNNWPLVKQCSLNWLVGLVMSLLASTLYFVITPFYESTDALNTFSKATIYDVMLAFFGGAAAFIGFTRLHGVKIIAGVAVATACMPPLSTAGFGIANGQWNFLWGGFYFYFINCVFIGLAVMLLTRYMNFAKVSKFSNKPLIAQVITVVAFASIVPAGLTAWNLYKKNRTKNTIDKFIANEIKSTTTELSNYDLVKGSPNDTLNLYVTGSTVNGFDNTSLKNILNQKYGVNAAVVVHNNSLTAVTSSQMLALEKRIVVQDSVINLLKQQLIGTKK
jgi:uncharacterized hydrophobic protein (TIGR00271 family)